MSERRRADRRATREATSFRLPGETLQRLDAQARGLGLNRTTLAERLLEEGLRLVEHPGIAFRDGAAGRRACLAGTGLDVWEIVETIQDNDGDLEAAAEYHGISRRQAGIVARYYAAYPSEIDSISDANAALVGREATLAAEQRRLLA